MGKLCTGIAVRLDSGSARASVRASQSKLLTRVPNSAHRLQEERRRHVQVVDGGEGSQRSEGTAH